MIFTGERFLPAVRGPIALEHRHRYTFSRDLAAGKRVLDLACGEGYGSAIVGEVATHVCGVDIDEQTIAAARASYASAGLEFQVAPVSKLPYADASFDLAVSFETLEHVEAADQERMLAEVRRVLAPDGALLISTPNKLAYTDRPAYTNPFHLQELYVDEFRALLERYFPFVRFYGQRVAASSFIFREEISQSHGAIVDASFGNFVDDATYVVALCASAPIEIPSRSAFFDARDDTLADMTAEVARRERELRELQAEYAKLEAGYYKVIDENRAVKTAYEQLEDRVLRSRVRSFAKSPFRNSFAPLPPMDDMTLSQERSKLRSSIDRCREARIESARERGVD